ncbi:HEPN domain-containing protein [Bordetella genomosp. 9]|uniref:HEPN domain-containing protein n=1 Tax=Bordetella genomosp. 9 TaxID=1416803 RepID=UPI0011774E19|nr:HEPN domain-containing protein [Bordetella genomosp. 9]
MIEWLPRLSHEDLFEQQLCNDGLMEWAKALLNARQKGWVSAAEELVKSCRALDQFKGMNINSGFISAGYFEDAIVSWITWLALHCGMEYARNALHSFCNSKSVKCQLVTWVHGPVVDGIYTLDDSVRLIPIEQMPPSRERQAFQRRQFEPEAITGGATPATAMVSNVEIPTAIDLALHQSFDVLTSTLEHHSNICYLMNAVTGVHAVPGMVSTYLNPFEHPWVFFQTRGGQFMPIDVVGSQRCVIGRTQMDSFVLLINEWIHRSASEKQRLLTVLRRLAQAKRRSDQSDKILDLCIALEMLLLSENKTEQLSLSFRVRGAWLLGKDAAGRKTIYSNLKQLYTARSKVAHTGRIETGLQEKMRDSLSQSFEIAEKCFRFVLSNGFTINWDSIILQTDTEH